MTSPCVYFQGIGLMISSTLLTNGAKAAYVVGPKQADLDR